jgi:hypothetical protein
VGLARCWVLRGHAPLAGFPVGLGGFSGRRSGGPSNASMFPSLVVGDGGCGGGRGAGVCGCVLSVA